jgi:hypothetical protein
MSPQLQSSDMYTWTPALDRAFQRPLGEKAFEGPHATKWGAYLYINYDQFGLEFANVTSGKIIEPSSKRYSHLNVWRSTE